MINTREYYYAIVTEDFLSGAPYDPCAAALDTANCADPVTLGILQVMQQNALNSYTRLDQESCIKIYSNDLLTDHTYVVAVTSDTNATNSIFIWGDAVIWSDGSDPPSSWICSQDGDANPVACDASSLLRDASSWTVHGHPIQYCLSLPVTQSCQLQFSVRIMAIVLVCNAIKLLTALYVLFGMTSFTSEAMLTVGDALQSFLVRNDVHTKDKCLAGENEFPAYWWWSKRGPRILSSTKMRWYRSASLRLWITVILRCVLYIPCRSACLIVYVAQLALRYWACKFTLLVRRDDESRWRQTLSNRFRYPGTAKRCLHIPSLYIECRSDSKHSPARVCYP